MTQSQASHGSGVSNLKASDEVVFYPSLAVPIEDGKKWECEIRGRIYRPDKRRILLGMIRRGLRLRHKLTAAELEQFKERALLFMVDNKRGRKVLVRLADQVFALGKSKPNGHFSGTIILPREKVQTINAARLTFEAILSGHDQRIFQGELAVWADTGLTIISDIDDTIRITQVRDRRANLARTFLRPFEPVPGMAEAYRTWATSYGANFCYVSASPWQLFSPLSEFITTNCFPDGTFYLRNFRWKDRSLFSVLASPRKYKMAVIEKLFESFPARQFVLVGDTGEKDPEIYADLATRFPKQVRKILLRDVTGERAESGRYQELFGALPELGWEIFSDPSEIMRVRF